jgi:hypothetical protein
LAGAVLCCHDGRRGYLYHLAVAANFRRTGIGRQLVERCLARLKDLGITRCTIVLVADNAEGEAFWRQTGWRERSWFHVRDYGLMVANPFGQNAFTKGEKSRVEIQRGDSLRLRYTILAFSLAESQKSKVQSQK